MIPVWYKMLDPWNYGITDPVICETIKISLHICISLVLANYMYKKRGYSLSKALIFTLSIGFCKELLDQYFGYITQTNRFFDMKDIVYNGLGILLFIAEVHFKPTMNKLFSKKVYTPIEIGKKTEKAKTFTSLEKDKEKVSVK